MAKSQEELEAARAALRESYDKLQRVQTFTEEMAPLLELDLSKEVSEDLEATLKQGLDLLNEELARNKELRDVTIPALEAEQPEYPQYQAAWLSYAELRAAHIELIGVGAEQTEEAELPISEAEERMLSESLGVPFLTEYIEWAKTLKHPTGLDLSIWPHTLPDPPNEPRGAEEQLKTLLSDPDGAVRAFGRVALTALAEARTVRDYKSQRKLN